MNSAADTRNTSFEPASPGTPACPRCGYPMIRLADLKTQSPSEAASGWMEEWPWYVWAWDGFTLALDLLLVVIGMGGDALRCRVRERRLRRLRARLLPAHPASRVCAACLHVLIC